MSRGKRILTDYERQIAALYYTPQEAQHVLGMDRDTFNNHVRRGSIHRYTFVGSHGYFRKTEIDALAEKIEALLLAAETSTLLFRRAELTDLDAINRLAYYHFGDGALTPERKAARQRFLEVNPDSTYALFDGTGERLLASIDLVPLTHEAILEFREGKRGWQFPSACIEAYAGGHPLELIIIDMMTTLSAPPRLREFYAADLLRGLARQFETWAAAGIEIVSIDACGGTEQGRHILESAGFAYCGERQPRRHMYHLEVASSDLRLLRGYKARFAATKAAVAQDEPQAEGT